MIREVILKLILLTIVTKQARAVSSPLERFKSYPYYTELQSGIADLWWSIDQNRREITFEFHVKTTGWIGLGISPAGGMAGADIGLGWIDQKGQLHFEDRYATGPVQPTIDTNSTDWIGLQGREENGWTAIQSKRPLDSCDDKDVPIKSGTNILIDAYGIEDPEMVNDVANIKYHDTRRNTKIIPLQSYAVPPAESKLNGLDSFEFKLNNYKVPAAETTYYCQVYRAPRNITQRRHSIAYKTLVDQGNEDLVHHLLLYECNPTAVFNDTNLPRGLCDDIYQALEPCASNIATGWAVGGDYLFEFPEAAGYPVGGDFEIKYYMIQMHYDNPYRMTNRTDSSGIRFYMGNQLRQHELGYLTLGSLTSPYAIAIPPNMDKFIIDGYCPSEATQRIPKDGITVVSAFPHTHLQGKSVWTKIIRNKKADRYLFNAESYDFNYQFGNVLPEPIKLYPGDEFATRCIYQTKNKASITLGGEGTRDEMCLHMLAYYPRMKDFYSCYGMIVPKAWNQLMNVTQDPSFPEFNNWLLSITWNNNSASNWQKFFDDSQKIVYHGFSSNFNWTVINGTPKYDDLQAPLCSKLNLDNSASSFFVHSLLTVSVFILSWIQALL